MSKLSKYFKQDTKTKTVTFIGEKLDILISARFESYKCLKILNTLITIGLFDMVVNDKEEDGFFLPTMIEMEPSHITRVKIHDQDFVKATFLYGDVFIKNTEVQQIQNLGYVIFYEIINMGNRSKHLDYFKLDKIFDKIKEVCGIKFNANRKTFELICAHIHRSQDDINVFYRQTDMKKPPYIIKYNDIAHGAVSTTGRLIGNYADNSLRSIMVNPSNATSDIENILRS